MALSRARLPKLCIGRSTARVRVPSPTIRPKPVANFIEREQEMEVLGNATEVYGGDRQRGYRNGNKVMVVVDSSMEAKGALEWALSYAVQSQDTIVLLYVTKPFKQAPESDLKVNLPIQELLYSMKSVCQIRRPGVEVEVAVREGKEKGPTIVEEAKRQRVSLLVLGQRRRSITWHLIKRWAGRRHHGRHRGAAEYCIQNASCMTISVRRKGKKLGGYLITTKHQKNFWLLA